VERKSFNKTIGNDTSATAWGYSTKDRGTTAFSTKVGEVITVKSDWVSEATNDWLEELMTSPDVYVDDVAYGLVPVEITNGSYDLKQEVNDKLWNISISFKYTYDTYRQSR
jgi:hypothetical protein